MKAIRRMILALLEAGRYAQIATHAFKEGKGIEALPIGERFTADSLAVA